MGAEEEEARKDAEEKAEKEAEAKAKRLAMEKPRIKLSDYPQASESRMAYRKFLKALWEKNLEKSHPAWQQREARQDRDDQASTRASSPCTTSHDDSMYELETLKESKVKVLLQMLSAQAQGATRMSRSEIAQLVRDAVAEYNKKMPGWEVPVSLHSQAELGATTDNTIESNR